MSILNGLREAWIRLNEKKKVEIPSKKDIVYSEDNDLIEEKLNEILERLINNINDENGLLVGVFDEIINRKKYIYSTSNNDCNWKNKLVISDDNEFNHFELFVLDKKIIDVVVNSTLKGGIVSFTFKYKTDVSRYADYKCDECTRVIDVSCLENGDVDYKDVIYSLDLLNKNHVDDELNDNLVSYIGGSFSLRKKTKY